MSTSGDATGTATPAAARPGVGTKGGPGRGLGLWTLFRALPVLSWSVSATAVGLAAVVGATGWRLSYLVDGLIILAGTSLFQGFVAHGLNDAEDWRSGTDILSPGLLSGGSRVIPRELLTPRQVLLTAWTAALLGLACAALLWARHGPAVLAIAAIGMWSAVAYTQPPLRLSYRPLVGELLAGLPAVTAIIAGTYLILAGRPGPAVWGAALVQAIISVAWVMQHHLPDVTVDLRADPPKVTTPAWFARTWGPPAARLVPLAYFLAAATLSAILGYLVHPVFVGPAVIAALGAREAYLTDVSSVPDITAHQLRMMALCAASAALLTLGFLYGRLPA